MIKDMIQSLPSILPTQKKYRDQIDHQISRVFESLYSFPLSHCDVADICTLNEQSYKGNVNDFTLSNDGKKFIKIKSDHCGITVKKGISSGKYRWIISYDNPVGNHGWILIGVQLNKPICSSPNSATEGETFGIVIYSIHNGGYGKYYIEGKESVAKERNLRVTKGEELEVIVDCSKGIFRLISCTFNHSISIPILQQNQNYYLHFDSFDVSFSLLR